MSEALFDLSNEYEAMLNRGIRLSGEDRNYFVAGRVQELKKRLPRPPRRILDFGCGIGNTAYHLSQQFPNAQVVGIDTSRPALDHATAEYGSDRVRFETVADFGEEAEFDLCYVNGVFHHIQPKERLSAVSIIHRALAPGGLLALFENNPWNLGARLVMSRIPFDRDAQMLTPRETRRLVREGGFNGPATVRSLFYFPRVLGFLRFAEPTLSHFPLGAQYYVLAGKKW